MTNKTDCYTCKHMTKETPWFCGNKQAVADRGTYFPDAVSCSHWESDIDYIKPYNVENEERIRAGG